MRNSTQKHDKVKRALLVNDDGIHATGLSILEKVVKDIVEEVWVVAPSQEQSGASRSFSLKKPLRLYEHGERRYSVEGTPADCTMLALKEVMDGTPPDFVISGVNFGSNLGEEVAYSGTVSAAFEATIAGIPAIAMSQLYDSDTREAAWHIAEEHAETIIRWLLDLDVQPNMVMNVNFPPLMNSKPKGVKVTHLDHGNVGEGEYTPDRRIDTLRKPYYWNIFRPRTTSKDRESDVGAVEDGYISITPLRADFTDQAMLSGMKKNAVVDL